MPTRRPSSTTGTRSRSRSSSSWNAASRSSVRVEREDRRLRDLAERVARRVASRGDDLAHERLARHDALQRAVVGDEDGAHIRIGEPLAGVTRRVAPRRASPGREPSRRAPCSRVDPRASSAAATSRIPATSAALRNVRCFSSESSHTRSNASPSFSARRARISSRSQNRRPRSCTHSKYETVTPPAFVRTSGQHENPALGEDRVRLDRRRAVRALGDQLALQVRRVLGGDLILARGEDEDVARTLEQNGVRDPLPFG